jgi:uncharacterized protein (TIGR03083 family)
MNDVSWLGPAIDVRPVAGRQQESFVGMLRGLTERDWTRPTVCAGWDVKDVAAHVLGDYVGQLSRNRDGYSPLRPRDGEPFAVFLDRLNDEWVQAARRLSPRVLVDQLAAVGAEVVTYLQARDMDAIGGAVSWAGPDPAPVWLDAAREFSEYWTHQQQICEAIGRAGLTGPDFLGPVIDTFMRALPHTMRAVAAPEGTILRVAITGPGEGTWDCTRGPRHWRLSRAAPGRQPGPPAAGRVAARLELDSDTAWRLCTRGISPQQATLRARIDGDHVLATAALQIVSIIWSGEAGPG